MTNAKPITVSEGDLNSLSARLQRLHAELPASEKAVFEQIVGGAMILGTPTSISAHRLYPPPPPVPHVPHTPGGGTHLITGGTGGFTAWVGANGKLHVYHPIPGEDRH